MRHPVLIFLLLILSLPLYSVEYDGDLTENVATTTISLKSDTGSYIAGFSSNPVYSWSTAPNEHPATVRRSMDVGASGISSETFDLGYVYWKLRSTQKCELYLGKQSNDFGTIGDGDSSKPVKWQVYVTENSQEKIIENCESLENPGTLIHTKEASTQMSTDPNCLPLFIYVEATSAATSTEDKSYTGVLTITLKIIG